jgi:hypothetical protein
MVEADATNPSCSSDIPRFDAYRGRVGDFDAVELYIASKPAILIVMKAIALEAFNQYAPDLLR